jgi:hypothetical protein
LPGKEVGPARIFDTASVFLKLSLEAQAQNSAMKYVPVATDLDGDGSGA